MMPSTSAPFRLTLISPYEKLAVLVRRLAPEYNCELTVLEAVLDEVRDVAEKVLTGNPDVLLSRGGTAQRLRALVHGVPIVSIAAAPLDLLRLLQPFSGHIGHVAFFTFEQPLYGVDDIANVLGMRIDEYVFHSQEEMRGQLLLTTQLGTELVVGGQLTMRLAADENIRGLLLEAGEYSVREVLREAAYIAEVRRTLDSRTARLSTILDNIAEGVIVTDENDTVSTINPAAERLLNTSAKRAIGKPIASVVKDTRVPAVRRSRQAEIGELLHSDGGMLVANRVPIISSDRCEGVVCTFADGGRIQKAEQRLRRQNRQKGFVANYTFDQIWTVDKGMEELKKLAAVYARANATVLLQGETGTGKELFAQSIHSASDRAGGPFVAVNCAAIPEALLESELFGYEEGAFTGARKQGKPGLFELARDGTLFLDEIGELPGVLQARLLRVLQEREVMRVGGDGMIPINARVIGATNRDLAVQVAKGEFRRDLFYRFNVLTLSIPALRDRRDDILHIGIRLLQAQLNEPEDAAVLMKELEPALRSYDWPGNLRELQNTMERLALVANMSGRRDWARLLEQTWPVERQERDGETLKIAVPLEGTLKDMLRDAEHRILQHYLERNDYDQTRVAFLMGMSRMSLWRRLQEAKAIRSKT